MNKLNISKYKNALEKLCGELKRVPLPEEIACEMDLNLDKVIEIQEWLMNKSNSANSQTSSLNN